MSPGCVCQKRGESPAPTLFPCRAPRRHDWEHVRTAIRHPSPQEPCSFPLDIHSPFLPGLSLLKIPCSEQMYQVASTAELGGANQRRWDRRSASAGLQPVSRPRPLCLPSLRAGRSCPPIRHRVLPTSAALCDGLMGLARSRLFARMGSLRPERSTPVRLLLAAAALAACPADW